MSDLKLCSRGRVIEGRYHPYEGLSWLAPIHDRAVSRSNIASKYTSHEISERSDGQWEVMDKTLKVKLYPDKDTMLTALALQGVNVDES